MNWKQLTWADRSVHLFPENDDTLQRVACGAYYNVRFTRTPSRPERCEGCVDAIHAELANELSDNLVCFSTDSSRFLR